MKDDIAIANLSLSRIGISTKIDSLTQRTKEAIELNNIFEEVRDRVLAAAPWPFARKIVTLQMTGSDPLKWLYRYEYPNDCLATRMLIPPRPSALSAASFRSYLKQVKFPFELLVDGDSNDLTICTDLELASLEYTMRVTNPLRFDALFGSTFAWLLAAEVALPLAKGIDYANNAGKQYENAIAVATAKAYNEETPEDPPDSEFVRERW
jgi:hypothetical protein